MYKVPPRGTPGGRARRAASLSRASRGGQVAQAVVIDIGATLSAP